MWFKFCEGREEERSEDHGGVLEEKEECCINEGIEC